MNGRTMLVVLALMVVVGAGLGLALVHFMSEGRSAGLARPARGTVKSGGPAGVGKGPAATKDLREFMKLLARTGWLHAEGKDFRGKAGAWQDAVELRSADPAPLLSPVPAREATLAYMLWDAGSPRAKKVGERLLTAASAAASAEEVRAIYRILSAAGHPRAKELRARLPGPAGTPPGPESCKLWQELKPLSEGAGRL